MRENGRPITALRPRSGSLPASPRPPMPHAASSRSASPPAPLRGSPRSPTHTRSPLPELRTFLLHLASERGLADNSLHAYRRDLEDIDDHFRKTGKLSLI